MLNHLLNFNLNQLFNRLNIKIKLFKYYKNFLFTAKYFIISFIELYLMIYNH